MSSVLSIAPSLNGFRFDSPSLGEPGAADVSVVRDALAPLLTDASSAMERLAVNSREPGFALVTVCIDDRVVGYGAATRTSVAEPADGTPPVTVGGFTAEAVAAWAVSRGRGEAMVASLADEARRVSDGAHDALRLDPFVIDPGLDTITTDHVAGGLVAALLDRHAENHGHLGLVERILVRPGTPAVAVLLRSGWRAVKMDPLSEWAQFATPAL